MTFEGMDTEAVRSVSQRMVAHATQLESTVTMVDQLAQHALAIWDGPDVYDFHGEWVSQHRPRLVALHQTLATAAADLLRQAGAQEQVSGGAVASHAVLGAAGLVRFAADAEIRTGPHGAVLPAGWAPLDGAQLKALGIAPGSLHDPQSGLDAAIYADGRGHYVLAFAGSAGDMTRPWERANVDWAENYRSALNDMGGLWQSTQTEQAADLAVQLKLAVGAGNMQITGHSLGGREAAVASVATGVHAVTFNAASATDEDLLYARELAGKHVGVVEYAFDKVTRGSTMRAVIPAGQIENYTTWNDALTNVQMLGSSPQFGPFSPTRPAVGTPHVAGSDTWNPVHAHSLNAFDGQL